MPLLQQSHGTHLPHQPDVLGLKASLLNEQLEEIDKVPADFLCSDGCAPDEMFHSHSLHWHQRQQKMAPALEWMLSAVMACSLSQLCRD